MSSTQRTDFRELSLDDIIWLREKNKDFCCYLNFNIYVTQGGLDNLQFGVTVTSKEWSKESIQAMGEIVEKFKPT